MAIKLKSYVQILTHNRTVMLLYLTHRYVILGLDNLGSRLEKYKTEGCEFARWRCVFKIGKQTPSYQALKSNSETIARFASICQSRCVCPVIEPHVK